MGIEQKEIGMGLCVAYIDMLLCSFPNTESALQLTYAAKEAGGNPKSVPSHEKVDEAARFMLQAVTDLTITLEKAGGEAGLISGKIIILLSLYTGTVLYP